MSNIGSRLDKLETISGDARERLIWIEPGETRDQALSKAGALEPGEVPVLVGWARS